MVRPHDGATRPGGTAPHGLHRLVQHAGHRPHRHGRPSPGRLPLAGEICHARGLCGRRLRRMAQLGHGTRRHRRGLRGGADHRRHHALHHLRSPAPAGHGDGLRGHGDHQSRLQPHLPRPPGSGDHHRLVLRLLHRGNLGLRHHSRRRRPAAAGHGIPGDGGGDGGPDRTDDPGELRRSGDTHPHRRGQRPGPELRRHAGTPAGAGRHLR